MIIQKYLPTIFLPQAVLNTGAAEILPSGKLNASNGKSAYFEFLNLNDELKTSTYEKSFSLGKTFKGEGIYLLSSGNERLERFWILANESTLTVEKANAILESIKKILENDKNLNKNDFWNLDGKKPPSNFDPMSRFKHPNFYQNYFNLRFSNQDPSLN